MKQKILIVDLIREKTDFYDTYLNSFPTLILNAEKSKIEKIK